MTRLGLCIYILLTSIVWAWPQSATAEDRSSFAFRATVRDLQAEPVQQALAYVGGYHVLGDGGGGWFLINKDDLSSSDAVTVIIDNQRQHWRRVLEDGMLRPEYFGAYGDDYNDDADAFDRMFAWALRHGGAIHLSSKSYKINRPLIVDIGKAPLSVVQSDGLKIVVEGGADIDGQAIADAPTLRLLCSATVCNNDVIQGRLTVKGSNSLGYVVELGDNISIADINYLVCQNFSAVGGGGCKISNVTSSHLRLLSYVPKGGLSSIGINMQSVHKNTIEVQSAVGTGTALTIEGGLSGGNTFTSFSGSGEICISIHGSAENNVFLAPEFSGCNVGIDATQGKHNLFVNPNFFGTKKAFEKKVGLERVLAVPLD